MLGATIVALLAADIVLPIPASVLGIAGGAALGLLGGMLTVTLGLTLACLGGYWVGRAGGTRALARFMGTRERQALEKMAARHGVLALALSRPLPVLGEASVILAGAARLPLMPVLLVTTAANAGLGLAYAGLGTFADDPLTLVLSFIASLALPGLGWLLLRALRRRTAAD
jgi:3-dehydroquinate synthase